MLIAWDNKADDASLTTDSELASLPAANVQDRHVSRKWHTAATVTAAYLILDLGSSIACALAALLGTNLTTSATIRIRASDADPTVVGTLLYDSGVVAAGAKANYGGVYKSFTSQAARYWRFDISDAGVDDNLQIGRVFLGPKWTPSVGQPLEWFVVTDDPSDIVESYGGQSHADELPKRRVLVFSLDWMNEAEMYGNAFEIQRANGRVRDVLAIPDAAGSYLPEQAVWGLVQRAEPIVHRLSQIYRTKYEIKERL